jgi:hypothetical protein
MGHYADMNIDTCETILQGIAENGGATVTVDGLPVDMSGAYIVAMGREYETVVHPDAPDFVATVLDFVNDSHGRIAELVRAAMIIRAAGIGDVYSPIHLGAWVNPDDGLVYLDLVQVHTNRDAAIALGRARKQHAIFDTTTGADIPLHVTLVKS